eukprot:scaffold2873_cov55-Phaeocystis_antarctica.AAC.2
MALFLLSFWDSSRQEALVLVAIQIIAFFAIQPYLIGTSVCAESVVFLAKSVYPGLPRLAPYQAPNTAQPFNHKSCGFQPPGLSDWRNIVTEEAGALMHSSVQVALRLQSCACLIQAASRAFSPVSELRVHVPAQSSAISRAELYTIAYA